MGVLTFYPSTTEKILCLSLAVKCYTLVLDSLIFNHFDSLDEDLKTKRMILYVEQKEGTLLMPSNSVIAGMMIVLSSASASVDTAIKDAAPVTTTVTGHADKGKPHSSHKSHKTKTVYATKTPKEEAWDDEGENVSPEEALADNNGGNNEEETTEDTPSEPGNIPGVSLEEERMFDQLAECESGGDWHINTGNGYFGGIQFNSDSWNAVGGQDFAPTPDQATREQQIVAGKKLKDIQGWGAWPACSAKYGFI